MKLLLDENIDVRFKYCFSDSIHEVLTVRDMKWNGIKNGKLLKLVSDYDFDVLISDIKS
jgi:predicted nuclease of predicted toxin-antitoxin system